MRLLNSPSAVIALAAASAFGQGADPLMQEAGRAYGEKRYAQAAVLYTRAFEKDPGEAAAAYNAACCHALLGDAEAALRWLDQALKAGFLEADDAARDADFTLLHADPRWPVLLERMRTRQSAEKAFWNSPALTTPFKEQLSEDERIAGLSRFWSEVKFNFVDTDRLAAIDWDGLYLKTLPKVRAASTPHAFYQVMAEFCAHLKDGHTNVWAPAPLRERLQARPLLRTRLVEGRVIVTAVHDEGMKARGVVPGVEITAVEGRPVKAYAEAELAPYQSASTPQDLETRVYTYAFLSGPVDQAPLVDFVDAQGRAFQARVPRAEGEARRKAVPAEPPFTLRWLPGDIAVVALNSFGDDTAATRYLEAFPEIRKAKALIFDLRANGGGHSGVGYRILATLADRPFATTRWSTRDYKPTFRAWGRASRSYHAPSDPVPVDPARHYGGPVAVLIAPGTYSAAEDFAVAFDAMQRGLLVGEPTGGSTGQPLFFPLPGGGSARVCTKRDTYPDGRPFVGVGVQPGRLVSPTVADLRAGRDTVLEAALAELGSRR